MIDHDRLFKELLSTFFVEFIELFFPDVMAYLEPESVTFPNLEVFTDVTAGERYETDLIVRLLQRKVGELEPAVEAQIRGLDIDQLEDLGEALLDFEEAEDLTTWLASTIV